MQWERRRREEGEGKEEIRGKRRLTQGETEKSAHTRIETDTNAP
jgi:hypothetical protein